MTNKSTKKRNLIWALVALVAVVAIFAGVYFATVPTPLRAPNTSP